MTLTPSFVNANGLRFAYFEEGTGPLVLTLHGFPDTAHPWDDIRPVVAAAGSIAASGASPKHATSPVRSVAPRSAGARAIHQGAAGGMLAPSAPRKHATHERLIP
ncbi:MAG TPA: hypothetical protein PK141_22185 [Polyangiaceae bacterium]|jgi:pimeloyl-ACP methyl ester carboxylesterase|nr:hypothetical protein [Polyangiaceae bacterium]